MAFVRHDLNRRALPNRLARFAVNAHYIEPVIVLRCLDAEPSASKSAAKSTTATSPTTSTAATTLAERLTRLTRLARLPRLTVLL
jgi:hypothetical protein